MKTMLIALVASVFAATAFAGSQVVASRAALSTTAPQATQIGIGVLQRGGNAVDAAVAVAFALSVVEPQSGGVGGGGYLVYYDAKTNGVWTLDFSEVSPLGAKRDMFVQPDGTIAKSAHTGPLAGAVPGSVAGLETLHGRFGSRPWKELLVPAIRVAREGFTVDADLANALADAQKQRAIDQFASTGAIFYPNNKPLAAGARLTQPDLAVTLERIGEYGAAELYDGETADKMVRAVRTAGGILSYKDLKDYRAVWRAPIRIDFRDYAIYTMAPPSAGGLVLGEALNILSGFDLVKSGYQTPATLHLIAEAERRAYIDRNKYLGDPATTRIPYGELLSADRARQWRTTIDPNRSTPTILLAEPGSTIAEGAHTTHVSIVDAEGNVVSLTTTLHDPFGSGFVVPGLGFFLNDAMVDFTTAPGKPNGEGLLQSAANSLAPSKRMASSMSPTIVLRGGKPWLAIGTPGGPAIPTTILQVLLNLTVFGKSLQDAVAAPRWHQQGLPEEIQFERGAPRTTVEALNAMAHGVAERDPIGDVHAVMIDRGKLIAVADPRHHGAAGGF